MVPLSSGCKLCLYQICIVCVCFHTKVWRTPTGLGLALSTLHIELVVTVVPTNALIMAITLPMALSQDGTSTRKSLMGPWSLSLQVVRARDGGGGGGRRGQRAATTYPRLNLNRRHNLAQSQPAYWLLLPYVLAFPPQTHTLTTSVTKAQSIFDFFTLWKMWTCSFVSTLHHIQLSIYSHV